jgi:hypothetical protein
MTAYDTAFDAEAAFAASRAALDVLIATVRGDGASDWTADAAEDFVALDGREVLRLVLQGFFDTRTAAELGEHAAGAIPAPVDADGRVHRRTETGHHRDLTTVVGTVTVTRCAFRAPGTANLYRLDAALNLPVRLHSAGISKLAVAEAVRGSFADADAAIAAFCGPVAGNRQVQQMTGEAAADIDAFYTARIVLPCGDDTLLILTVDGKGIVMRTEDLREDTAKAAEAKGGNKMATRLATGEKRGRKRMATLGAVYDAEPAVRRPHDIIDLAAAGKPKKNKKKDKKKGGKAGKKRRPGPKATGKWLTGSVRATAAEVIGCVFDQAEDRDPTHRRTWVALVDGARAQIDAINTEAAARGVDIHIIVDFVHVAEYVWDAAWALHAAGDRAAEVWVGQRLAKILNGRSADVADELRATAEDAGLPADKRKALNKTAGYLTNKAEYLGYDKALADGWPIATGVIEGACRHLVKDRLDITGTRWSLDGAEAVLKLRALVGNDDLPEYWRFHLAQEQQRNHRARYQHQYDLAV